MIPRPGIGHGKSCPNNNRAEEFGQPGVISNPSPDKQKYPCFDTLAVSIQFARPEETVTPKNSDVGGYHIAFYVDDIKAAKDYLDSKGVKTFFGPFPVNEGPAAGQSIVYFLAPWACKWRSSAIRKGWPTRNRHRWCCGRRESRRSEVPLPRSGNLGEKY
jgi:catechol 2,3-dioxygenase-like lactoylglutathione lyase family enzyme